MTLVIVHKHERNCQGSIYRHSAADIVIYKKIVAEISETIRPLRPLRTIPMLNVVVSAGESPLTSVADPGFEPG